MVTSKAIVDLSISHGVSHQPSETTDLVEKLRAQNVAFEELIFPDEIHDRLRRSDWIRAYRATAEFFDRKLAAPGERH